MHDFANCFNEKDRYAECRGSACAIRCAGKKCNSFSYVLQIVVFYYFNCFLTNVSNILIYLYKHQYPIYLTGWPFSCDVEDQSSSITKSKSMMFSNIGDKCAFPYLVGDFLNGRN